MADRHGRHRDGPDSTGVGEPPPSTDLQALLSLGEDDLGDDQKPRPSTEAFLAADRERMTRTAGGSGALMAEITMTDTLAKPLDTLGTEAESGRMSSSHAHAVVVPGPRAPRTPALVYLLTVFAGIGGFLFGFDTGVISGALLLLREQYMFDEFRQEVIVSSAIAGAVIGSAIGGALNDRFGRKPLTLFASVVFVLGALVMGAANGFALLVVGRIGVGIAIGVASMVVPVYIAEVAPGNLRGGLVTVNVLFITTGQLVSYLVDAAFATAPQGWRWMLGLAALPALIMLVGMCFLPESPRWLVMHEQREAAVSVLKRLRGWDVNVAPELAAIEQELKAHGLRRVARQSLLARFRPLCSPAGRRALWVGLGLQAFQQLCGINTVMYYSPTILQMAGYTDTRLAIWMSVAVAGTNALMTVVTIPLIDRVGRRPMLLWTIPGVALSLLLLGVAFQVGIVRSPAVVTTLPDVCQHATCWACVHDPACAFCDAFSASGQPAASVATVTACLPASATATAGVCAGGWQREACPNPTGWLALLALILYLMCFAPGLGPVPWAVNSEIYALPVRGLANGLAATTNWLVNFLVSFTFLSLLRWMTELGAFLLYAAICALAWLFVFVYLPETKGKTLEQLRSVFEQPSSVRWKQLCGRRSMDT